MTSCFVVMGFNTKKIPNTNIEVDLNQVYNNLIKPTILEKELVSVHGKNHFRADEVFSTQSITKTFIEGILKADIVIADITTLNQNAIYELGLRHAMKPKSTIILCDHHTAKISFFDIAHLPQIRYDSDKLNEVDEVNKVKKLLSEYIDSAIKSDETFTDSPAFESALYRVIINDLIDKTEIQSEEALDKSIAELYDQATELKNSEKYPEAEEIFQQILESGFIDEEILAGYLLSSYKKNESSLANLKMAQQNISKYIDINTTTYHKLLGIYGAIFLRIFYITKNRSDLMSAINYYRLGMNFEDRNIYCARNYCANLLKIALVEKDVEVLKEFYYTSVYTAKTILGSLEKIHRKSSEYDDIWFLSNQEDLMLISGLLSKPINDIEGLTERQKKTINEGSIILSEDIQRIKTAIVNGN
ncbi:hypothetical protein [Streptococcus sp. HMSC065C01]|uniref:hypothetical protein n=1 Tax=Streptococcus sp. HMSC065C01 TaxID=1739422 RepID=UPI0008A62BB0|nr:hypothetical protein [Streptococcus sp. HMSC065C01]OFQ82455.1 hypothetical protein HMPREF2918_00665 [Streptococcus sp. HMSC065C01]